MKKKFAVALSATLLTSAALAGCGKDEKPASGDKEKKKDQVLNLNVSDEIPSMDSAISTDELSFNALINTNEGLYRFGLDGKSRDEGVAIDHELSDDGTVYTFNLRDDAKWSNGDPVTANDFEYAWKRVLDPKTASQYAYIMADIKGADEAATGKGSLDDVGVKAIDATTLEVTLKHAAPYFADLMTFPTFFPQNQKFVEAQGEKYALEADTNLYNGPFVMTEWVHGTSYQLKKNDQYWDAKSVKLDTVNNQVVKDSATDVNLYKTGKADIVPLTSEHIDAFKDKADEFLTVEEPSTFFLRMNQTNKDLANVNIRRAIALSIDKDGIVDEILNNGTTVANYFVPKNFTSSPSGTDFRELNGDFNAVDKEEAKKYWEQGLKELGKKSIKLDVSVVDDDVVKKMSEYLQEQLESNLTGLKMTIQLMPFKQKLERETKLDYDTSLGGWGADYVDPMTFLDMFTTTSSYNQMKFSNAEYDKLIADAKGPLLSDLEKRYEALLQAEKILLDEEVAIVPIYQRGRAFAQKAYVKDVVRHQTGGFYTLKWAYIK